MLLFVGLGNPTPNSQDNRHNIGFKIVDAIITNFHLPGSSLIMLVSAFIGKDKIKQAYRHAINSGYRFYSYGDAMLIT